MGISLIRRGCKPFQWTFKHSLFGGDTALRQSCVLGLHAHGQRNVDLLSSSTSVMRTSIPNFFKLLSKCRSEFAAFVHHHHLWHAMVGHPHFNNNTGPRAWVHDTSPSMPRGTSFQHTSDSAMCRLSSESNKNFKPTHTI